MQDCHEPWLPGGRLRGEEERDERESRQVVDQFVSGTDKRVQHCAGTVDGVDRMLAHEA